MAVDGCVFDRQRGFLREIDVNEFETAFEAGDSYLELVNLTVETVDDGVAGGRGVGGEREFPMDGDERVKAEDLPAGDGDVANDGGGNGVEGKVDGAELVEELIVLRRIFVREHGTIGFGTLIGGHG